MQFKLVFLIACLAAPLNALVIPRPASTNMPESISVVESNKTLLEKRQFPRIAEMFGSKASTLVGTVEKTGSFNAKAILDETKTSKAFSEAKLTDKAAFVENPATVESLTKKLDDQQLDLIYAKDLYKLAGKTSNSKSLKEGITEIKALIESTKKELTDLKAVAETF